MQTPYDIIIIGSGLGGLLSAVLLAKEGKKVCVLEKNNQYGGNLQTFVRNKIIFDTGVHYAGSLHNKQILYRYFDYAGIAADLELERLDPNGYDRICFANNNAEYPHAQGYDNFIAQLLSYFPEEKTALMKYTQKLQEVCDSFPLYRFSTDGSYNEAILSQNLNNFIKEITNNHTLQAVLLGSSFLYGGVGEATPLYVHALSVNSYIESAYRLPKGGSQITKLLVKQLRRLGADIYKHSEVINFGYNGDRIESVTTKEGKQYYAHTFLSNIDVKKTIQMAGKERFKRAYNLRIENLKPTSAAFSLHLVMQPNTFQYLPYNLYWFRNEENVWNAANYSANDFPLSYMLSMVSSKKHSDYAESISVLTYMRFEEVAQWEHTFNTKTNENTRGAHYEAFKQQRAELLLDALQEKFPDIRKHIKAMYTSTPLTYRDYINASEGSCYGYQKESTNPMASFILPQTHIPNLFLTGHSVNMHGLLGVTIGAVRTCLAIVGKNSKLYDLLQQ